eukprot:scaffold19225_cov68-Phaeocystis_antarctica.AAC.3
MNARLSSNTHRGALRTTTLLCSRSVSCHGSFDTAPAALPYTVHSVARTLNENRDSVSASVGSAQRTWLAILTNPGLGLR